MARRVLLGVAAVAVIVTGYFVIRGWPPAQEGTEGAIRPAERHREEQISNADVALKDPEIQDLMQTDFFHQLVTDKNFQKMVLDGSAARVAVDKQFLEAVQLGKTDLARQQLDRVYLGRSDLADARAGLEKAMLDKQFLEAVQLGKADLARQQLEKVQLERGQLERQDMAQVVGRSEFARAVVHPGFEKLVMRSEFRTAMASGDARSILDAAQR